MSQPIMNQGPPMVEVKHIFFKARPPISYFADEADGDAVDNEVAFQQFNKSLECSNKYGCLLLSYNNSWYLVRISDIVARQNATSADHHGPLLFKDFNTLEIRNAALPQTPNIISLSNGEEFLAVDTVRGDAAWVVVFSLSDFINQSGACRPLCEIRCSSSATARIRAIGWNPGENMNNVIAINVDDGSLFLAKIKGPNNVELNRFADGGIRCLCWSPKGKQLVVGRTNGNLSQLKLDLTEAKQIPAPEPNCVPVSILWTQTTQFLIVFHKESFIDFMQLDVVKNTPPIYTNSGDIFVSDLVPTKSSCYFIPFMQWSVILAVTNSASDLMVLTKEVQNQNEIWSPGDITDNRRAAFLLDNYARGAAVFYGCEDHVIFSETESYAPMPMIFLLSQRGHVSVYSVVNSDPQAPSLNMKVTSTIPDSAFAKKENPRAPEMPLFSAPPPTLPGVGAVTSTSPQVSFQPPQLVSSVPSAIKPQAQAHVPTQPPVSTGFLPSSHQSGIGLLPKQELSVSPQQVTQRLGSLLQPDPRKLATSTLPTAQDLAVLQKAVEEKRREMTTHLQKGSLKGLEDDDQCSFVMSEIRKFEQRLSDFTDKQISMRGDLTGLLNSSFGKLEKDVLATLNVVEDFVSDMVSTTGAQKEEIEVLKERILNHFSQLEYAKSIVERSRDPRYLEHLRSRQLDPASRQKFQEIRKLHNYVRNQVAECRRFFYEQNRKKETSYDRIPPTQLIYLTLANHSQIIRRLNSELDKIKLQLGLGKHITAFDEAEFLTVDTCYNVAKKAEPVSAAQSEDFDDITLTDLTSGISRVKLNRDSDRADRKPIRFANRKLLILKKCMPEVNVIKVKADETPWTRTPSKPARRAQPKAMTYPTASFEGSFSRLMESANPLEFNEPQTSTPAVPQGFPRKPEQNVSFMGMVASPGADLTITSSKPASNLQTSFLPKTASPSSVVSPGFGLGNTVDNTSSSHISSSKPLTVPKSNVQIQSPITNIVSNPLPGNIGTATSTASPSAQMPTLTGLLSTPPASSASGNLTSSSLFTSGKVPGNSVGGGLFLGSSSPFTNPASSASTATNIFGTGAFSFGTQSGTLASKLTSSSTVATSSLVTPLLTSPPTNVVSPTTTAVASRAPPTGVAFGISKLPITTSSSVTSPIPSIAAFSSSASAATSPTNVDSTTTIKPVSVSTVVSPPAGTATTTSQSQPTSTTVKTISSNLFSAPIVSSSAAITTSVTGDGLNLSVSESESKPKTSAVGPFSATQATPQPLFVSEPSIFGSPSSTSTSQPLFGTISSSTTNISKPVDETTHTVASSVPPSTVTPSDSVTAATSTTLASPGSFLSTSTATSETAKPFAATSPTSTTGLGIFGTSTTSASIFGAVTSSVGVITTTTAGTSLLSGTSTSPPVGLFSSTGPAASGILSSTPSTVVSSTGFPTSSASSVPSGFFQAATTTPSSTTPGLGFMSSLNISDSTNKTVASTAGGLFSAPAFGSSQTPAAASIFGGSSTFGAQNTSAPTGGANLFSQPKTTSSTVFGNASATTSVFGGAGGFGSSSPFGSSFGTTTSNSTFGSPSSNVFGSTSTTTQSSGFGALAQGTQPAFGSSAFGSGGQQQSSIFGSPTQQKPATSGSIFSSSFGSPAATSTASIFGGGGTSSIFGGASSGSGAFSAGVTSGGVAQQGFGFGQSKPPTATGFGSPTSAGANPVFGGTATFGSTSPFGSSFGSSSPSTFGAAGNTNVFGGSAVSQTTSGFGALAQQGSLSPGFGNTNTGFNAGQHQQQPSLFGSPPQQQPTPAGFGGQAFSSWR